MELTNQMQSACPHCGYCRHCGRGGQQAHPFYPQPQWPYGPLYPQPSWIQPFTAPYQGTGGNVGTLGTFLTTADKTEKS